MMKKIIVWSVMLLLMIGSSTFAADLSMCNGGIFEGGQVRYGKQYPISDSFKTPNAAIFRAGSKIVGQNVNVGSFSFTNGGAWGGPTNWVTPAGSTIIATSTAYVVNKSKDMVVQWHIDNCLFDGKECVQNTRNVHVECMKLQATWCGDGAIDTSEGESCDDGNETSGDGCSATCQTETTKVDCKVSDWSDWSVCTNGVQTRTRSVITPASNGGDACPALQESKPCPTESSCNSLNLSKSSANAGETISYTCNGVGSSFEVSIPGVLTRYTNQGSFSIPTVGDYTVTCKVDNGAVVSDCQKSVKITTAYTCESLSKNTGDSCDDGDASTTNDTVTQLCQCVGTPKAPVCGDGIKNGSEQCDYNDGAKNGWGNGGCTQQCTPITTPTCTDPNAENNGSQGSCTYKYACNENRQCVVKKGGQYTSSTCDNACTPPDVCPNIDGTQTSIPSGMIKDANGQCVTPPPTPTCTDPNAENNGSQGSCTYKYACNENRQCVVKKGGQYTSSTCDNACTPPTPTNTASLGDYVWVDINKNGVQDPGEIGVPGVKVYLYQLSSCGAELTTPIRTTTTDSNGKYDFSSLEPGIYKVRFELPYGYDFTNASQGGDSTKDSNAGAGGLTSCITLASGERNPTIDAGLVMKPPVSCEGLTLSHKTAGTTTAVTYKCTHENATSAVITATLSGGSATTVAKGFDGTFTLSASGSYMIECVLDGSISYRVTSYDVTNTTSNAYKRDKTTGAICAVQSTLKPFMSKDLDLTRLVLMPTPVPYCTSAQEASTNYESIPSPAGSQLLTKEDKMCQAPLNVVVGARLGDYLWYDANNNGIQDAGESGIGGSTVTLYACTGSTPLGTTTTNANGLYLFENLKAGSYKVKFDLPGGYNGFVVKGAGMDTAKDSNVDQSGMTACIDLPENGEDLTIDAGVYKSGGGGGGGGGYNFCGDGAINSSNEQCDDGNLINGDGCSSSCQREGGGGGGGGSSTPSSPTKPTNALKSVLKSGPLCDSIDPPDVNMGEYLPFWWTMEHDTDVNLVDSCSQAVVGKTNIIRSGIDSPICTFEMRNGKGEKHTFLKYCFDKSMKLDTYPLIKSFFSTRSVSKAGYDRSVGLTSLGGAGYFGPASWTDAGFTALGEYSLSLTKTTFKQCVQETTANKSKRWVLDNTRYQSVNDYGYGVECQFNFTVTKPYFVQKGVSLGTTAVDAGIISSFYGFSSNTAGQIISNITQTSNYARSQNLTYLATQFVTKYKQLATSDQGSDGSSLPPGLRKVPGKSIYVYHGSSAITLDSSTPIDGTLISLYADVIIKGDVRGVPMIIAIGHTIDIIPSDLSKVQLVQGILIADKITSSQKIINNDLSRATWANKGGLKLYGVAIGADVGSIASHRRSSLDKWFNSDETGFGQENKKQSILDGASFMIETDPGFWTNLPPGANEMMSALETYK